MINTILFDLDGTLVPFMQDQFVQSYFKVLIRRLAPMGYDGEKLVAALWKGTAAMVANDGSATNRQVFWNLFTKELGMEALGLESILDDFYARDFDKVRTCMGEEADRSGLIHRLREKGYSLILATNPIFPTVAVETRLHWVGLCAADFDSVTTYENSRHSKPNPLYFQDILTASGKRGEECLMIGNNPVEDMAAQEVGMSGYLVTDYMENPDHVPIESYQHGTFAEMEAYLDGLPSVN